MEFLLDDDLLKATRAEKKIFYKGDIVLNEGDISQFFYFLKDGALSVFNFTEKGKELLQHKVTGGHFFFFFSIILGQAIPGNVEVYSAKAHVIKMNRELLFTYLKEHSDFLFQFMISVAQKSLKKSLLLKQIVLLNPEERIMHQLRDIKRESSDTPQEKFMIKLTRKEISHMTGLRIETVIRTIKKIEKDGKLEIINGKIFI